MALISKVSYHGGVKRDPRRFMKADIMTEIEDLVEKYRDQCLWFLRQDFIPRSHEEVLCVLDLIERYGDRAGFERAQRLRRWLLLPTSVES